MIPLDFSVGGRMNLALKPEVEEFVRQQARQQGYSGPTEYITHLLDREWKKQLEQKLAGLDVKELPARLREGAKKRSKRDRLLAQEWFDLEEEAYAKRRNAKKPQTR